MITITPPPNLWRHMFVQSDNSRTVLWSQAMMRTHSFCCYYTMTMITTTTAAAAATHGGVTFNGTTGTYSGLEK